MPSKKDDKYTDPELREEVKEEVQAGDKGGKPGQWSARKAQMMASEYKKRGGGYTTDKKDESAKHLDQWTEEEWQTKDGSGHAKKDDGTEQRYLPKKAWEQMSEKEKKETDAKKQEESREGKQYVLNTSKASQARKNALKGDDTQEKATSQKSDYSSAENCTTHWEDPDHLERNLQEYKKFQERNRQSAKDEGDRKRANSTKDNGPNKKQKSSSGKQDEPSGAAGSITRVPKHGQQVQWHSLGGYIGGEVVEVVYKEKEVDGKKVKASKEDPRIVLKSETSGKICVHKPDAVYFD